MKAATGEVVTSEDLGGGAVHTRISGVSDHLAENEEHALWIARNIASNLNTPKVSLDFEGIEEPVYDIGDLNYIVSSDLKRTFDSPSVLARLLDGSKFEEYKREYGSSLITGFGRLYNQQVGIVANNGILFSESAQKGANFV